MSSVSEYIIYQKILINEGRCIEIEQNLQDSVILIWKKMNELETSMKIISEDMINLDKKISSFSDKLINIQPSNKCLRNTYDKETETETELPNEDSINLNIEEEF